MENKLLKKLQVKPGFSLRIFNAPRNLAQLLGDVPEEIMIEESGKSTADALLIFATDSAEMQHHLPLSLKAMRPDTVCWVAYPKKTSGIQTDLNLMSYWQPELLHGLEPCASVSIDDTWTAIRLRPAGTRKVSGLCNDDIAQSPWAQYIDVTQKKILSLPQDFQQALATEPAAKTFFETLSYSNKKEYLLWNLAAKQEKTKQQRLEKTIGKLTAGKKNPAEK